MAKIAVQYAILSDVFEKKHSDRCPNLSADVRAGKNPRIAIRGLVLAVLNVPGGMLTLA